MRKEYIIMAIISVVVIAAAIVTGINIKDKAIKDESKNRENIIQEIEEVSDECTEEYRLSLIEELAKETNSTENKVSVNADIIFKKYYKTCGHTINIYTKATEDMVNLNEEDMANKFQDWKIIGFQPDEIIMYKELDENCGEHFSLKIENGKVVIYQIQENGEKNVFEKTDISAEYLPDVDLLNINDGLEIYGKENLNKILEDFE